MAGATVFTGTNAEGQPGIGMLEVAGFAWAANTFAHFGLIDMALLRYAKKARYGYATGTGMLFGHYVAWISAGLMGAAVASVTATSIAVLEPGDVAWYALGASGFVIVVVAGWTTANANIYRAGLAAQAVLPSVSRVRVTMAVGLIVVVASAFPFVYRNFLPLVTYCGVILVPIGGIIFAEHHLFKRLGLTQYWARYKGIRHNVPALVAWAAALVVGFGLDLLNLMPYYFVFIPAWLTSIVVYTLLAKASGAADSYPEEQAADAVFEQRVDEFHEQQAETEDPRPYKDRSVLGRVLKAVWIISLILISVAAWRVLFFSPDLYTYYVHRESFYQIAIVCTIVYFVVAYAALQRTKWLRKRALVVDQKSAPPVDTTVPRRNPRA